MSRTSMRERPLSRVERRPKGVRSTAHGSGWPGCVAAAAAIAEAIAIVLGNALDKAPALTLGIAALASIGAPAIVRAEVAAADTPRLGRPVSAAQAQRQGLNIFPDGRGLPAGRGNATEGRPLFARQCAACHGEAGRGATAEELAGGTAPLTSASPDKTIGLYWPYATTLFDFIRRAMPLQAPGSLTADEVYALTAYLLFENRVVGEHDTLDARTLPNVRMPNRNGFVGIDAPTR